MKKSKYNSAYPFINILSYIFLVCGIVLISLEIVLFFRSEDYTMVDSSDKYFMVILMLLWYVGLRYFNKRYINKH
ncbi:hypothetical protein [Aquiflexum lacus]|uniref:hypothetical protein n=1 Tax=Aquiflexum lacus TaxID=2483805 RepID=UPI00189536B8|nr:hypothetical protein [Aquiflexum lacus]